jgi:hypothetical protein
VVKPWLAVLAAGLVLVASGPGIARAQPQPFPQQQKTFWNFESGHARPLAVGPGPNGPADYLYALNTPDNRLEVFSLTEASGVPALVASVVVGLEPVAVAVRKAGEVWVVNHLSDSVSIVRIVPERPHQAHVERTLLVCDEPRDIVFAGRNHDLAFITTARRGQNCPVPADLTTPGIGRAVVQVFDGANLEAEPGQEHLGAKPLANLVLFSDTPRALTASRDGKFVYAAAFLSGNGTSAVHEHVVTANGGMPAFPDGHLKSPAPPATGTIVRWDEAKNDWLAADGKPRGQLPYTLADKDVFVIDARGEAPVVESAHRGAGTVIYAMAARPPRGISLYLCTLTGLGCRATVYIANTEAHNFTRFEDQLVGHFVDNRISIVGPSTSAGVKVRQINPLLTPINKKLLSAATLRAQSTATPVAVVLARSSKILWVAGLGSDRLTSFSTQELDADDAAPLQYVDLSAPGGPITQGPSGLAYDPVRDRLYVMQRLSHSIAIVDNVSVAGGATLSSVALPLFSPERPAARAGRAFLYDARDSSRFGDASCASCHVFGDFDALAWDLGNAAEQNVIPNKLPFEVLSKTGEFHPLKGPMTTQSFRGMAGAGPMHWRGDKYGDVVHDSASDKDERGAFLKFAPAFESLLGRQIPLSADDPARMDKFADFVLTIVYPPNPIRLLSDGPTSDEAEGERMFMEEALDEAFLTCERCHRMPLGTNGKASIEREPQDFKIAHLRNMYQKVGMFGVPAGIRNAVPSPVHLGEQVRGFGYLHDGTFPTLFSFLQNFPFTFCVNQADPMACDEHNAQADADRRKMEAFLLAFDTGLKPMVGQQVTAPGSTSKFPSAVGTRLTHMIFQDEWGNCDLIAYGNFAGFPKGFIWNETTSQFLGSDGSLVSGNDLIARSFSPVTFTCVPPGSGDRIGRNRDMDSKHDWFDNFPADPTKQ